MPRRELPEINASSMADIAFLLLTFFLIATTLDKAEGIERIVPDPDKVIQDPPIIHDRNLLRILVNKMGQLQIDGEDVTMAEIRPTVKEFLDNRGGIGEKTGKICEYCRGNGIDKYSLTPQDAVISLELDNATPYNYFFTVENLIDQAFIDLYDQYSKITYQQNYAQILEAANKPGAPQKDVDKLEEVENAYPKTIAKARLRIN